MVFVRVPLYNRRRAHKKDYYNSVFLKKSRRRPLNRSGFGSNIYWSIKLCQTSFRGISGTVLLARRTSRRVTIKTEWATIQGMSSRLSASGETVRKRARQPDVNAGFLPGFSESQNAEIRGLKKEDSELRRANEILRTALAPFARGATTVPQTCWSKIWMHIVTSSGASESVASMV
jgi:hypothetical protein